MSLTIPLGWLDGVVLEGAETGGFTGIGLGFSRGFFFFRRSLLRLDFGGSETIISSLFSGFASTFISSVFVAKSFPRSFRPGRSVFSSAAFGESLSFLKASVGVSGRGFRSVLVRLEKSRVRAVGL